jgi:hypothetical protein
MKNQTASVRQSARVAGGGLLLMAVLAGTAIVGVIEPMVSFDNAAATAADIRGSIGSFRLSLGALLVVVLLDVVVSWALFVVFESTDAGLSRLAAWMRLAYTAAFAVAISHLAGAANVLTSTDSAQAFGNPQTELLALIEVNSFYNIWDFALGIFGVHLGLLGVLIGKTSFSAGQLVSKGRAAIAGLLFAAGAGYLIDSFGGVVTSNYSFNVGAFTFVGEVVLMGWLLMKGFARSSRE